MTPERELDELARSAGQRARPLPADQIRRLGGRRRRRRVALAAAVMAVVIALGGGALMSQTSRTGLPAPIGSPSVVAPPTPTATPTSSPSSTSHRSLTAANLLKAADIPPDGNGHDAVITAGTGRPPVAISSCFPDGGLAGLGARETRSRNFAYRLDGAPGESPASPDAESTEQPIPNVSEPASSPTTGNDDPSGGPQPAPSGSARPDPTSPATRGTSTPRAPGPTASTDPEPTRSSEPDPTESTEPEPTESTQPEPTESTQPEPTESTQPEPTRSASRRPAEPAKSTSQGPGPQPTAGPQANSGATTTTHPDAVRADGIDRVSRDGERESEPSIYGLTLQFEDADAAKDAYAQIVTWQEDCERTFTNRGYVPLDSHRHDLEAVKVDGSQVGQFGLVAYRAPGGSGHTGYLESTGIARVRDRLMVTVTVEFGTDTSRSELQSTLLEAAAKRLAK